MEDFMDDVIKELMAEHPIIEMVKFSDLNLSEKLSDNPWLMVKYKEFHIKENAILVELQDKYDMLVGKQYDYYRFELDKELTKPEIEKYYLPKDKKIIQMKQILRKQELRVKFFEMCYKGLEQQGWRIKSWIDVQRSGM